jgi:hypothetical protein
MNVSFSALDGAYKLYRSFRKFGGDMGILAVAKKPHRVIGDPLRKFKEAPKTPPVDPFQRNERRPAVSIIQEAPEKLREFFEGWMEIDARLGLPFMTSTVVSERTGIPDEWWFRKARELGCQFDDPAAFWQQQRAECKRRMEEFKPAYIEDVDAAAFFVKWGDPNKGQRFEDPNWTFDYTWAKCKAGPDALPDHTEVPSLHKGTFFAMSVIARRPEMTLGAYIKCGMPIVQDLVAEYLMYLTDKMNSGQKPKDWKQQLRILLRDVNWEEVETVLKEGERAYTSKNMHNILKSYRNIKTPGQFFKRIMDEN